MYKVDISPTANAVLEEYKFRCANDNETDCALRLLDSFDSKVSHLESTPMLGCARIKYLVANNCKVFTPVSFNLLHSKL